MTDQYADFERDGEQTVRDNVARGAYNGRRAKLAREWLQRKADTKTDAFAAKQLRIARSAKNAAWAAAVAAIVAAMAAIAAIAITVGR
jgi:hypothetical protein